MKKKLIAISLCLCLLISASSLFSCSSNSDKQPNDSSNTNETLIAEYDYDLSEYIKVGQYKGLTVTGLDTEVTQADIQTQIDLSLAANAYLSEVDRPAEEGDTVNIDYTGYMNGEAFENGADTGFDLKLGSGSFIDGFEDQLVGANKGDTVNVEVTFPDPYRNNPDFAGKPATFEVKVNSVQEEIVPEYNDDFVKKYYPDYNNTAEYEEYIKETLQQEKEANRETTKITNAWMQVVENSEVIKYPEAEYNAKFENELANYEAMSQSYFGMELEEYLTTYQGTTLEDFKADLKTMIESTMKEEMILESIIRAENITLTDEEYTEGAQKYADAYQVTVEELESTYTKDVIYQNVLWDKVFTFIADSAIEA